MRIIFMGTPALAARVLERLLQHHGAFEVVAVVTRPDQPRNRGLKLEPSEVAAVAMQHGIATLRPIKIRTAEFAAELKALEPDLIVVAAYGRILPNSILELPRLMPLNVHASLLPRYRGAAPIEGAILAGERETGITIMRITEQMDAGPILLQRALAIAENETQGSLKRKLAELGAETLIEALGLLARNELQETPQDQNLATYTSPISRSDAMIDWSGDALRIERMVRAFDPWPVARTRFDGEDLLIWQSAVVPAAAITKPLGEPGTIVQIAPQPVVKCGSGYLALIELQAPGRRRTAASDFMRGRRAQAGSRLGE